MSIPYQIEKGVSLPERAKYPFSKMSPGDSFFVPGGNLNSLRSLCSRHSQDDKTFIARSVDGGVRVWRLGSTRTADQSFPRASRNSRGQTSAGR